MLEVFASKSEEKRVKTRLKTENHHEATIKIWPTLNGGFGVATRVDGKGLRSKMCKDKAAILAFLDEVL